MTLVLTKSSVWTSSIAWLAASVCIGRSPATPTRGEEPASPKPRTEPRGSMPVLAIHAEREPDGITFYSQVCGTGTPA